MRISGRMSNSLDDLVTLVEFLQNPKERKAELKELQKAAKALAESTIALENAHAGAKKLEEADARLNEAAAIAGKTLADAALKATKLVKAAEVKVGKLTDEKKRLTIATDELNKERALFNQHVEHESTELMRRDARMTKRENDLARGRVTLKAEQAAMRDKAERVEHVMRG